MLTKPLPGVIDDPFHPLSQGCVCHLLMNEGAGSLTYDVSGRGNHGTLKNMLPNTQGSGWVGSKFGGGLAFDAINNYVDFGNDVSLDLDSAKTVEFRAKFPVNESDTRIYASPTEFVGAPIIVQYGLKISAVEIVDASNSAGRTTINNVLTLNQWHHIVAVYDGVSPANTKIYIDGIDVAVEDQPWSYYSKSGNVFLGGRQDLYLHSFWDGAIDDVRIYNRALTAQEIKQLYHDPFCNLLQVPTWQLYSPPVGGLNIPIAMHHYEVLRG